MVSPLRGNPSFLTGLNNTPITINVKLWVQANLGHVPPVSPPWFSQWTKCDSHLGPDQHLSPHQGLSHYDRAAKVHRKNTTPERHQFKIRHQMKIILNHGIKGICCHIFTFRICTLHVCGSLLDVYVTKNQSCSTNSSHDQQVYSSANLRIVTFLGSNWRMSPCSLCSLPWILQDLLNTMPASISMARKMSLACRERSESWWIMFTSVWQPTSSNEENNTGFRSLPFPFSSLGIQPSHGDNLLTRRGSMLLWWKGIFISYQ